MRDYGLVFSTLAILLGAIWLSPWSELAAAYFPIMTLAPWLASIFTGISLLLLKRWLHNDGAYGFLVYGQPLTATVVDVRVVTVEEKYGQVDTVSQHVTFHLDDPNELYLSKSPPFSPGSKISTLRRGDEVTALALEDRVELYGALGLTPESEFLQPNPERKNSMVTILGWCVLLGLVVGCIIVLWALPRFPLWSDVNAPFKKALWFVPLGLVPLTLIRVESHNLSQRRRQRDQKAVADGGARELEETELLYQKGWTASLHRSMTVLGMFVLTWVLASVSMLLSNALLDDSEPRLMRVPLVSAKVEVNNFLYSNYLVTMTNPESGLEIDKAVPHDQIGLTMDSDTVIISVKDGYFGWPWIAGVKPFTSKPQSIAL